MTNRIGTLSEKSLHAGLKRWIAEPGDRMEVAVDGFVIDVVRGDENQLLIEIQTRHFGAMKRKLKKLLQNHRVLLLHPIPQQKWIVRETAVSEPISRRKSPKKGKLLDIFKELMRIPHLLLHPNLTIGVLLTHQEEIWRDDGKGSWRRKRWSVADHRLLEVVEMHTFSGADWLNLLPEGLPLPFTNRELAETAVIPTKLAQQMSYTLRHTGLLNVVGKRGNALLYEAVGEF